MTPMLSSSKLDRLGSVYRDCLSRYKSVFILYSVVLFVSGPVFLFPEVIEWMTYERRYFHGLATEVLFHFAALLLSCLLPLLLFSYINNRQAVDVYHAMPVTRDKLYWGNVLGGATVLLTPYLVFGVPCGVICEALDQGNGMLARVCWIALGMLALYSTMVFVMVNCGTLFESIIYFGIAQLAYPLMILAVTSSLGEFTFGWEESIESGVPGFLAAFAPGYLLVDVVFGNGYTAWRVIVQQAVTITAALFFGMILYRRRRSESAGSAFAFKPLFYVGALMVSITAGVGCYLIFSEYNIVMAVISIIVGVLCYFILDTIRNRGLSRVKETVLVSLGGVIAVGIFYGLAFLTGTFGYENYVPSAGVKSVSVQWSAGSESYLSSSFDMTDEANIARVIEVHHTIVDNKKAIEDHHEIVGIDNEPLAIKDGYIRYGFDDGSGDGWDYGYGRMTVEYTMHDGRTVARRYNDIPLTLTQPLYQAAASGEYRNLQWIGLKEAVESGDFDNALSWNFSCRGLDGGWYSSDFSNAMAADLAKAMIADLESRPDDWNVHPDSAPISEIELYPHRLSSAGIISNYSMNIYERDRNTIAWLKQHGYAVGDGYVSSSGQDVVVHDGEMTAVTEPMPTIDSEIAYGTEVYEHSVAVLRASDRDTLWKNCKELFYFGGYDSWQTDFDKMGNNECRVMLSERDLDLLRSKASAHYISEEPRDVLIIDGSSYLIYPEYSAWMHGQGYTLTK